jgi:hypothetical protein
MLYSFTVFLILIGEEASPHYVAAQPLRIIHPFVSSATIAST